jgi:hypothetical protein
MPQVRQIQENQNVGRESGGKGERMDKTEWAIGFKAARKCDGRPFARNEADVGVGAICDCGHVCLMEAAGIAADMDKMEMGGDGE